MEIEGTPSETGDAYTIAVTAQGRLVRKAIMWFLLIGNKREVLSRFETYNDNHITSHVVLKLDC